MSVKNRGHPDGTRRSLRPRRRRADRPADVCPGIWNKEECVSENGESSSDRGIVLRHGTVLSMDESHRVLTDADVLVVGDRIAAVGTGLEVPPGTEEIDAAGGIVMPGMIATHRHLWQTAMRGYGADWTLTQYFVWYYLEHGRKFRPEDIYAGNLL